MLGEGGGGVRVRETLLILCIAQCLLWADIYIMYAGAACGQ